MRASKLQMHEQDLSSSLNIEHDFKVLQEHFKLLGCTLKRTAAVETFDDELL